MLNRFISNISGKNGLAKTNRFSAVVNIPTGLGISYRYSDILSLQCEATELPGKSLITAEAKTYGPIYKVPYQTQYNDITLTFLCTTDFYERKIFEDWINYIMPLKTNNLRFGTEYKQSISISQYDDGPAPSNTLTVNPGNVRGSYTEDVSPVYQATLIDAFPINIAPQQLSWSDDGFHRLSVQFSYYRYEDTTRRQTSRTAGDATVNNSAVNDTNRILGIQGGSGQLA